MCGIVAWSGAVKPGRLAEAVGLLAHRGPDAEGVWWDERADVGLGHRRLAILDLSPAGHQPMFEATGCYGIVYNGEIYNFPELRRALERAGYAFRSRSDTEVLLALYAERGEAMLSVLNGIFAFALWDGTERRLFVARDPLGVKPLYYVARDGFFACASEIRALLALRPDLREVDPTALHRYLTFLWCPGEGTPLRPVQKLGPGEALVVQEGRIVRRWRWYRLPAERRAACEGDARAAVTAVADAVSAAVERQLLADVPVGAFLSGGLDSSAVVAMACRVQPALRCFTIALEGGHDAGFADDLPYAHRVAAHLGVPLEVVHVDAGRMASDVVEMVERLDEPLADPAPLNVLYIARLAREHGVPVLLSGAGGDDLFTGYRRHEALAARQWLAWVPRGAWVLVARAGRRVDQRMALARRIARAAAALAHPGDERLAAMFRWIPEETLLGLYTDDFARAVAEPAARPLHEFLAGLPEDTPMLERLLALEQRFFLGDHNLLYTDKMSMAAGVETRVPLLDLELVELAGRLDSRLKLRGRTTKWVFRRAMAPYLPREVLHRPKTGFGAPLRRWLRRELVPLVDDVLGAENLRRRGWFDPGAVRGLIEADRSGLIDAAYPVFALLCVELWARRFLDGS